MSVDQGTKREDCIGWDDYFMGFAVLAAKRSKDPDTQVGACIVNEAKRIVSTGYNGMPNGCADEELPWKKSPDGGLDTKYPYVCHAGYNAILNKNSYDVKGCTMYTSLFPCNECAKLVIQSGITEVIYMSDKYYTKDETQASRRLLGLAGVKCTQFIPERKKILIYLEDHSLC